MSRRQKYQVPAVGVVGLPRPFMTNTGATVVDPIELLRSQYTSQQVQSAESFNYRPRVPSRFTNASCRRCGCNPLGFANGTTLVNGPSSCKGGGFDDPVTAPPPGCPPFGTVMNQLVPQATFYQTNLNNPVFYTQGPTRNSLRTNCTSFGLNLTNAGGVCGQKTVVVGGPNTRNR